MQDAWNVAQYERFKAERAQPFHDLVALLERCRGMRVVDLGCGTGELTSILHQALGASETIGVDRSHGMLEKSAQFVRDGLTFIQGDIAEVEDAKGFDLVFSNAALQWLPDHPALFAKLSGLVRPGGQLAVQVPRNTNHPAQVAARDLVARAPFAEHLPARDPLTVLEPEQYTLLLSALGLEDVHVRLQVYLHKLASRDEVLEWSRGTLLTDYEKSLPSELFVRFLADYRKLLRERLEDMRPYPYTFKRILMVARKS